MKAGGNMQKVVTVEVISKDPIVRNELKEANGWGETAEQVVVQGKIAEVNILKDDKIVFSIYVRENGSLSVNMCYGRYDMIVPCNMELTNSRPWK